MKHIILLTIIQLIILKVVAPPVTKTQKEEKIDFEWMNNIEYRQYLTEILTELEKDKEFQKRVTSLKDHQNASIEIADQLQFASHHVRTKLDEIKRREIGRLNDLMKKKSKIEHPTGYLDHSNPDSFEVKDLSSLINKVSADLVEVDNKQEDEFKRYEMEKELKKRQKLHQIKDKNRRKEEEMKIEESKKRHQKHEKLHHPGSEEQLKDVWEKEDHLDRESFNPKTFFRMHDKDDNGHLDTAEIEALMMGELEKVYDENNPDDDLMERYHEMMKMRKEVMREVDTNNDTLVSYDEFLAWSKKREFKADDGWKTTEEMEKPVFTDEELERYAETYKIKHPEESFEDLNDHEDGKEKDNLRVKQHQEQREEHNLRVKQHQEQREEVKQTKDTKSLDVKPDKL